MPECPHCGLPVDPDDANTVTRRRVPWHGSCDADDRAHEAAVLARHAIDLVPFPF